MSDWEQIAPLLRPVLRREADQRTEGAPDDAPVSRAALPYLVERVVIDRAGAVRFVTERGIQDWGVDADTVYETARMNMAELAMSTLTAFEPPNGTGVMEFSDANGESYVGSLPLIGGWLAGVSARTGTRPLVFLPGQLGMFIVLGVTDETLIQVLELADRQYDEAAQSLSPVPYTVDERGELTPFHVQPGHPAWEALTRAEARLAVHT